MSHITFMVFRKRIYFKILDLVTLRQYTVLRLGILFPDSLALVTCGNTENAHQFHECASHRCHLWEGVVNPLYPSQPVPQMADFCELCCCSWLFQNCPLPRMPHYTTALQVNLLKGFKGRSFPPATAVADMAREKYQHSPVIHLTAGMCLWRGKEFFSFFPRLLQPKSSSQLFAFIHI